VSQKKKDKTVGIGNKTRGGPEARGMKGDFENRYSWGPKKSFRKQQECVGPKRGIQKSRKSKGPHVQDGIKKRGPSQGERIFDKGA